MADFPKKNVDIYSNSFTKRFPIAIEKKSFTEILNLKILCSSIKLPNK